VLAAGLETRRPDGRAVAYAYNTPGSLAVLGGQKAPNLFVFKAEHADYDRADTASQRRFLETCFDGAGWRVAQMLEAGRRAPDFYLDELARTRMSTFTRGRVALIGDAGYAKTLGGIGSGLALVGAYILAGELVAARGDYAVALAAYDTKMRKPTRAARSGNAGAFLAPPTQRGIQLRDWSFANRLLARTMMWTATAFAAESSVPAYRMR
jgi:2-polyprenyl-6-methoxyphenol hydroxylase-like FAD-dependent oxidoreductase